ncbi:hypothetical protein AB6A40_003082 [Gnathostoma spinigerum]|uniref:Uncharacterized protein n=1 Tax=Gnathostoma spinigerum TaxID=75299 RepID=A0ABD6E8G9_9BILA
MFQECVRRGFGPLIALVTSDGVEEISAKNALGFADLLLPFCDIQCSIKDPSGVPCTSSVHIDIRNIRSDGFLLSLTVLPSVLKEAVADAWSTVDADSTSSDDIKCATFRFWETLLRWCEPSEHELLRTYLACVFAVSTTENEPLNELYKLIQLQNTQQVTVVVLI